MTCACIRISLFVVVASTDAYHAVRAIHDRWMPLLSIPVLFKSDNGSAFISECMRLFRSLLGVRDWQFSAADDPLHHALLEHKHKTLNEVLDTAVRKGDIHSRNDLEFYVANALTRHNTILKSDGFTPFELLTGQPPRQLHDMVTVDPCPHKPLTPVDADLIAKIKSSVEDNIALALKRYAVMSSPLILLWQHLRSDDLTSEWATRSRTKARLPQSKSWSPSLLLDPLRPSLPPTIPLIKRSSTLISPLLLTLLQNL